MIDNSINQSGKVDVSILTNGLRELYLILEGVKLMQAWCNPVQPPSLQDLDLDNF